MSLTTRAPDFATGSSKLLVVDDATRKHWDEWWHRLTDRQRHQMIDAVKNDEFPVPPATATAILSTNPPGGPLLAQWNNDPSTATWMTLGPVVDYVQSRPEWDSEQE